MTKKTKLVLGVIGGAAALGTIGALVFPRFRLWLLQPKVTIPQGEILVGGQHVKGTI